MHTVVIDLNGLLCERRSRPLPGRAADMVLGRTHIYVRPYARGFVRWLLHTFRVGVWSSAASHNVDPMVDLIFGSDRDKLHFVWSQSQCTPLRHLDSPRPVLAKSLHSLFAAFPEIERSRTLLIDDSEEKASLNPACTAMHPTTWSAADAPFDDFLAPGGKLRGWLMMMNGAPNVPSFIGSNAIVT